MSTKDNDGYEAPDGIPKCYLKEKGMRRWAPLKSDKDPNGVGIVDDVFADMRYGACGVVILTVIMVAYSAISTIIALGANTLNTNPNIPFVDPSAYTFTPAIFSPILIPNSADMLGVGLGVMICSLTTEVAWLVYFALVFIVMGVVTLGFSIQAVFQAYPAAFPGPGESALVLGANITNVSQGNRSTSAPFVAGPLTFQFIAIIGGAIVCIGTIWGAVGYALNWWRGIKQTYLYIPNTLKYRPFECDETAQSTVGEEGPSENKKQPGETMLMSMLCWIQWLACGLSWLAIVLAFADWCISVAAITMVGTESTISFDVLDSPRFIILFAAAWNTFPMVYFREYIGPLRYEDARCFGRPGVAAGYGISVILGLLTGWMHLGTIVNNLSYTYRDFYDYQVSAMTGTNPPCFANQECFENINTYRIGAYQIQFTGSHDHFATDTTRHMSLELTCLVVATAAVLLNSLVMIIGACISGRKIAVKQKGIVQKALRKAANRIENIKMNKKPFGVED